MVVMSDSAQILHDSAEFAMIVSCGIQDFPADHAFTREPGFPFWTIEVTTSGRLQRRSGGLTRFRSQPDHALVLTPPEQSYSLRGAEAGHELWMIFRPREEWLPYMNWPHGEFGVPQLQTEAGSPLIALLNAACEAHVGHRSEHQLLALNHLEHLLLAASLSTQDDPTATADHRVRLATDHMRRHLTEPLNVPELAGMVHLSTSRFAHVFRDVTGESPMQYVERLRLEQAEHLLLRTDLTMKEIAVRCGFQDAAYFSTRFRRRYGRAPSVWRHRPIRA
jgi:AraC family transcriptional regulator of arabinose operon